MLTFKKFSSTPTYKDTVEFIKLAHQGQKYGNEPYWKHPVAVAEAGRKIFGAKFDEKCKIVSALHDVIEDTPHKRVDLEKLGFDAGVLDAVELLTKDKSLSYSANIQKIISSGNRTAMMVKYADNYMNFTGDKSGWAVEKKIASQAKYKKSIETIGAKLGVKTALPENYSGLNKRYAESMNMLGEALGIKADWTY